MQHCVCVSVGVRMYAHAAIGRWANEILASMDKYMHVLVKVSLMRKPKRHYSYARVQACASLSHVCTCRPVLHRQPRCARPSTCCRVRAPRCLSSGNWRTLLFRWPAEYHQSPSCRAAALARPPTARPPMLDACAPPHHTNRTPAAHNVNTCSRGYSCLE